MFVGEGDYEGLFAIASLGRGGQVRGYIVEGVPPPASEPFDG